MRRFLLIFVDIALLSRKNLCLLFDFTFCHYRCGVFVCLDCYQHRKGGLIKEQDQLDKNSYRDEYNWPFCTTGESHQIHKLLLAQIIPKNELVQLAHKVHQLRSDLGLNQFCHKKEDFKEAYSKSIMVSCDTLVIF